MRNLLHHRHRIPTNEKGLCLERSLPYNYIDIIAFVWSTLDTVRVLAEREKGIDERYIALL